MLGHWYTLLFTQKEAKKTGSHGIEKQQPKLTGYEVDRFSDFVRKPKVKRNDDDDLMIILMMQGG